MLQVPVKQAGSELDKLLNEVAQGEEVVIIGADGTAFKLTALSRPPQPIFGSAHGLIKIESNFDDPIEGFENFSHCACGLIPFPS